MNLTRKIAVIDHSEWWDYQIGPDFIERMKRRKVLVHREKTREDFEKKYGLISLEYGGLLLHPGIENQKMLQTILNERDIPKIAIASDMPSGYETPGVKQEIPLFSYEDVSEIVNYFFPKY